MNSHIKRGFTLIELLIVIVIIGVLSVTLIAGLDPLEKIRQSRDSSRLQLAKEIVAARQRYNVSQEAEPWGAAANAPAGGTALSASTAWLVAMVTAGEATGALTSNTQLSKLLATYDSTNNALIICVLAENTKAIATSPIKPTYNATGGAAATHICVR